MTAKRRLAPSASLTKLPARATPLPLRSAPALISPASCGAVASLEKPKNESVVRLPSTIPSPPGSSTGGPVGTKRASSGTSLGPVPSGS